ncbi:MAG: Holliday junction branch migration protein RuvA [Acidobacteriota bacterium]
MIAHLAGRLLERAPGRLVVDAGGVGYEVLISLNTFAALPAGKDVALHIATHVRDSAITLFGFSGKEERDLFEMLQTVAGIGPRLALGILSQLPVPRLAAAIRDRNVARLVALPGVGKRTAERVVTELSDKMMEWAPPTGGEPVDGRSPDDGDRRRDVSLALSGLGYRPADVERALDRILEGEGEAPLEEILKRTLRLLSRPRGGGPAR